MLLQELKPGVNVNIRFLQEANRVANHSAEEATVYNSKIYDILKDDTLELDMPTRAGKLLLLPQNVRYEFVFMTQSGIFKAEGTVIDRFKRGNFYLLKAKLTTKLEKHQRREYYRLNCLLPIVFEGIVDPLNEIDADNISDLIKDDTYHRQTADGTIVDISGGGIRAVSPTQFHEVQYCLLHFDLQLEAEKLHLDLVAKLIACTPVSDSNKYAYPIVLNSSFPKPRRRRGSFVTYSKRKDASEGKDKAKTCIEYWSSMTLHS